MGKAFLQWCKSGCDRRVSGGQDQALPHMVHQVATNLLNVEQSYCCLSLLFFHPRNIGLTPFMATVERVTITPKENSSLLTKLAKECWIESSIFGFRSAIKKFGVDRYKKNCGPATEGFNMVLNSHADGSRPFNGSGVEMKAVQHPPVKTGGELTMAHNAECVVSPNNVVPGKVALERC